MADFLIKKERRKSLSVFSPSPTSSVPFLPARHDRSPSDDISTRDKKGRRNSGFFGRSQSPQPNILRRPGSASSDAAAWSAMSASTPTLETQPRQKSLQKKRNSVFGSLKSFHSLEDDDAMSGSVGSLGDEPSGTSPRNAKWSSAVIHHGAIQTTGSMWRKKSQYLVLTETHLLRFKNQSKAADTFSSIPHSNTARAAAPHRHSVGSISSMQEMQLILANDASAGIPLNSIIAVYMLEDGRLASTVEVAYLDERTHMAALVQMQTPDHQELNLWMVGIRQAAQMARANEPLLFKRGSVEYVTRMLEHERDYDPISFRMFQVIQIASSKPPTRSSSDDLTKLSPTGCYLAIGLHKVHLIPMQKAANRSSVVSLSDLETATSFGSMNLTGLSMEYGDDSLHLTFR